MKKSIMSLAAMAFVLASCDTGTKDSYQTLTYPEYNLIVDNQDPNQPAQASYVNYEVKNNISKNVVDVKASDLVINNQKYSFETDTMALQSKTFNVEGLGNTYNLYFSKPGQAGQGSGVSNMNGTFVYCYMTTSNLLNPSYNVTVGQRLDLNYTLNDRYKVQTFWPASMYRGYTTSSASGQSHSTRESDYVTQIDFEKNTASVYVYNAKLSADQASTFPKIIRFEGIPVVFTHQGFSLRADAPKTTILGKKDNQAAMVDSVGFEAKDFSLELTSSDLTETVISYTLDGHNVTFRGCSILKPGF